MRFTQLHNFAPLPERSFCHLLTYNDGTNVFRHRIGQPSPSSSRPQSRPPSPLTSHPSPLAPHPGERETEALLRLLSHPHEAPNNPQLPYETNGYIRIREKANFHELRRRAYGIPQPK